MQLIISTSDIYLESNITDILATVRAVLLSNITVVSVTAIVMAIKFPEDIDYENSVPFDVVYHLKQFECMEHLKQFDVVQR